MLIDRRRVLAGATALGGAAAICPALASAQTDWHALAEDVEAQMAWSWDRYREHA